MKKSFLLTYLLILVAGFSFGQTLKTENWPNGQVKSSGSYKNVVPLSASASKADMAKISGQVLKVGKWQYWFQNGQLQAEENYTEGTKSGTQKSWYSNGKPEFVLDQNAGKATYWYENGQKQSEGAVLTDGTPTGHWTAWHDNGKKNSEGSYDQVGNKQGLWKFWDEKEQLTGQQNYVNGVLH